MHREGTVAAVEADLRLHVLPVFGTRPVGAIRTGEVQRFVRMLVDKGLSPASATRAYRWLASILRFAVEDGLIARSPCVKIKLPENTETRVTPLTVEQVEATIEAMPERYRALIVVDARAGLRISEALGLTVPHVDFLRRTIRIDQQLVVFPGRRPEMANVKAKASVRTIPVGDVVLTALAEHLRRFPARTELPGFVSGQPEPLVFTTQRWTPIRRTEIGGRLRPFFRAADLPDTVSYHDLRHFYASLLIAKGGSVKVVQERLGHASAVETLNVYSHFWADDDALSRTAVDEAFRPPQDDRLGIQGGRNA